MAQPTAQHRRWQHGIERAAFGVWDLDPRLDRVHYSPQWKAWLGFPRCDAPDDTAFWRCRVHPDDLTTMLDALRRHLDGSTGLYEARFRVRSNGSGYRTVLSRGRVVERDVDGAPLRMVGTMRDLTERPVAPARPGLVIEHRAVATAPARVPFHAALGIGSACPNGHAAGAGTPPWLSVVEDLLDNVESETAGAPRPASQVGA